MKRAVSSLMLGWIAIGGAALADDEELPDLEFLEYLGSWEASDEEWLLFEDGENEATADEELESATGAEKRKVAGVEK